jgi:hypothetical protein
MIGLITSPIASGSTAIPEAVGTLPVMKAYSCFQKRTRPSSNTTSPSIISPVSGFERKPE